MLNEMFVKSKYDYYLFLFAQYALVLLLVMLIVANAASIAQAGLLLWL